MSDSRRNFLLKSFSASSAAWLAANWPAQVAAAEKAQAMGAFTYFTKPQAADIDAMAAQIYPTTDTPGAREAQVIYFIDTGAGHLRPGQAGHLRQGPGRSFGQDRRQGASPSLPSDQQIALLTAMEKTPFFKTVRDHTIMGMFAAPQHGGNYHKVGWQQIGFDDSLNFRAPFGAYDKA